MEIKVLFFGPFREPVGEKTVPLTLPADATVADALDRIVAEFPALDDRLYDDQGSIRDQMIVAKNRVNIEQSDGLDTSLSEGDTLRLSPPVTGGTDGTR